MERILIAALASLILNGCATLERHPTLTAVGTALLAGSIIASTQHDHHGAPAFAAHASIQPMSCGATCAQ